MLRLGICNAIKSKRDCSKLIVSRNRTVINTAVNSLLIRWSQFRRKDEREKKTRSPRINNYRLENIQRLALMLA